MLIDREKLIEYFRLRGDSFTQMAEEGHVMVGIRLPERVSLDVELTDGYHTMSELYDHREELFIAVCRLTKELGHTGVWRSKKHAEGSNLSMYQGYFLLGIRHHSIAENRDVQIAYHMRLDRWDDCAFAKTLDSAPEWDGSGGEDTLIRLKDL